MQENPMAWADSVVPLNEDEVATLHAYWDQVLAEVWGPAVVPIPDSTVIDLDAHRREPRVRVIRSARAVESGADFGGEAA